MKKDKKEQNGRLKYILLLLFVFLMLVFAGFSLLHFLAYKKETDENFNKQNQNFDILNQKVITLADRFNEISIMEFDTDNYMDVLRNIQNAYKLDNEELFYFYLAYKESETDEQKQVNFKDYFNALTSAISEHDRVVLNDDPRVIPKQFQNNSEVKTIPLLLILMSLGLFASTGIPATI